MREHEDHIALQRLRRNRQLTAEDLEALEQMLIASGAGQPDDVVRAGEQTGGLGLFVRSLVGLERTAAAEAFELYLDDTRFNIDQVRFVSLIVDELTRNGAMEPRRLFESPYTDHAPGGPDQFFPEPDVDVIVETLHRITRTAVPEAVA